jgi:hypothetical protein
MKHTDAFTRQMLKVKAGQGDKSKLEKCILHSHKVVQEKRKQRCNTEYKSRYLCLKVTIYKSKARRKQEKADARSRLWRTDKKNRKEGKKFRAISRESWSWSHEDVLHFGEAKSQRPNGEARKMIRSRIIVVGMHRYGRTRPRSRTRQRSRPSDLASRFRLEANRSVVRREHAWHRRAIHRDARQRRWRRRGMLLDASDEVELFGER